VLGRVLVLFVQAYLAGQELEKLMQPGIPGRRGSRAPEALVLFVQA
jgi:hypothetical protein